MPPRPRPLPLLATLEVALAWGLTAGTAHAGPADYTCEGGATLQADFSPRAAQLRFDGRQWSLKRVRNAREARYVGADLSVVVLRSQATLERKGQPPLACKLVVRALRPDTPGAAPPAR